MSKGFSWFVEGFRLGGYPDRDDMFNGYEVRPNEEKGFYECICMIGAHVEVVCTKPDTMSAMRACEEDYDKRFRKQKET